MWKLEELLSLQLEHQVVKESLAKSCNEVVGLDTRKRAAVRQYNIYAENLCAYLKLGSIDVLLQ